MSVRQNWIDNKLRNIWGLLVELADFVKDEFFEILSNVNKVVVAKIEEEFSSLKDHKFASLFDKTSNF